MQSKIQCKILLLYLVFLKGYFGLQDNIPSILDEFKIHYPIIINTLIDNNKLVSIVKCMFSTGHLINFSQNRSYQPYQSYLIFTNLRNFKWNQPTYGTILVVSKFQNEIELNQVDVSIGSQVLFLDLFSLKVYESYTVNNIHVTRYLGQFQLEMKHSYGMIFVQSKDYKPSIERRRQNFYGLQIRVMTLKGILKIKSPSDFSNNVTFFPNNDTYDVTNVTNQIKTYSSHQQVMLMVLKWLETKFNFTAKVFLRNDMKVGSPKVLSNGSILLGEGAFRDMFEGTVDILCGSIIMLPERSQFGTFLPPISKEHDTIYIPIIDSNEYLDWNVFFGPFSTKLWIAVILKSIIISISIYVVEWFHNYKLVCC